MEVSDILLRHALGFVTSLEFMEVSGRPLLRQSSRVCDTSLEFMTAQWRYLTYFWDKALGFVTQVWSLWQPIGGFWQFLTYFWENAVGFVTWVWRLWQPDGGFWQFMMAESVINCQKLGFWQFIMLSHQKEVSVGGNPTLQMDILILLYFFPKSIFLIYILLCDTHLSLLLCCWLLTAWIFSTVTCEEKVSQNEFCECISSHVELVYVVCYIFKYGKWHAL